MRIGVVAGDPDEAEAAEVLEVAAKRGLRLDPGEDVALPGGDGAADPDGAVFEIGGIAELVVELLKDDRLLQAAKGGGEVGVNRDWGCVE